MTNNSYQTAARVRERTHALRKGAPWQLESRRHGSQMYLRCVIGQAAIDGDENGKKRHRTGSNVSTIPRRVSMGTAAHQPAIFEGTRVRTSRRIRTGLPASLPASLPACLPPCPPGTVPFEPVFPETSCRLCTVHGCPRGRVGERKTGPNSEIIGKPRRGGAPRVRTFLFGPKPLPIVI